MLTPRHGSGNEVSLAVGYANGANSATREPAYLHVPCDARKSRPAGCISMIINNGGALGALD
jgi:hypothetical protein